MSDLAEIVDHIATDDPEAASRFGNALLDHVDLLKRFPRMGAITRRHSDVRKLVHSPVLVYYRILGNKRLVEVLHFRHGSRKSTKL